MEPPELRDTRLKLIVEVEDFEGERGVFARTFGSRQMVGDVLEWLHALGERARVVDIRVVD